jgi:succinoglycan biosynthesis transport protein ExoP
LQPEAPKGAASDLREYIATLRYRRWSIVFTTALVVGSALFFSFRQTPIYESETRVLVRPSTPLVGVAPTVVNLETERALVDSAAVASLVQEDLALQRSPASLLDALEVSVETNTEILTIRYSDPAPLNAQRLAAGFAQAYIRFRREQAQEQFQSQAGPIQEQIRDVERQIQGIEGRIDDADPEVQSTLSAERDSLIARLGVLQQQMEVLRTLAATQAEGGQVVQPANLPDGPSSPDYLRNGLLALAVGLVMGVGLAFLRDRLDDRLRGREDLETQIGAPVLAAIPRVAPVGLLRRERADLVSQAAPGSEAAEAYRALRTNVQFLARTGTLRILSVVSPAAGEGKTTTAANLAVSLALAGKRVVVVSCDLRKPRLHHCFSLPNQTGVTDVLSGEPLMASIQRPSMDNVRVLASGPIPPNPAELLDSEEMDRLMETLRMFADFVILDTPPLLAVSDGLAVSIRSDGVLVVADAQTTTSGALARAREQLEQVGANVVGGIFNNFDASRARYYSYYHGSYYASYRPEELRGAQKAPDLLTDDPRDWDPAEMWR